MDLTSIAQIANPVIQTVFIGVLGLGYYFTIRNFKARPRRWSSSAPSVAGP